MNHQLQAQAHLSRNLSLREQLNRQRVVTLFKDTKVWHAVRNRVVVLCLLNLAMHMWLAFIANRFEQSIQTVENVRHELMEKQIDLRAERDRFRSPENIQKLAAAAFSLYVPDKEGITVIR